MIIIRDKNHNYKSCVQQINYLKSFYYKMNIRIILAVPKIVNNIIPKITDDDLIISLANI